ncbi:MAG: acetate--CoA ligase family protein [Planctomycetota bacterium]|jgi:acetyltransferase
MTHSLDAIFRPSSIALVGASREAGTLSYELLDNLLGYGFRGPVYPVNNKARVVHSIRAYASVLDIPGPLDLAIICVPKEHVLDVVDECGERGVKGLVVISAGFKEVGGEGVAREAALVEKVRAYNMRMVGPNCMGVINTEETVSMASTFAFTLPLRGRVGFISQSGAMGQIILDMLRELELGISKFVSIGNKADVTANDMLEYFRDDPDTDVVLLYLESFGNPFHFSALAKEITRTKPIIVVKGGRTAAGAKAAFSHTGALATTDVPVEALFEECGVIRVGTIEQMFNLAMAFSAQPLPEANRLAIVTNAGGPAILAVDRAVAEGMVMADLSGKTVEAIRSWASTEAAVHNPVDLVAQATPDVYGPTLRAILEDPGVDCALAIFAPTIVTSAEEFARAITAVSVDFPDKPVVACAIGLQGLKTGFKELQEHSIPAYKFPESAVTVLATLARYRTLKERPEGRVIAFPLEHDRIEKALAPYLGGAEPVTLPDEVAKEVLAAVGFPFPAERLAGEEEEAVKAAEEMGYPVVLKAILEGISHKSDIGGVFLDVESEEELRERFGQMMKNLERGGHRDRLRGVLVQQMVTGGVEVILGVKRDDSFGHLVMFGLGGIAVEVLRDVVFRIAPITDRAAHEMVRSIRGVPLLQGFRGSPGADFETIEESIQRLSNLVENHKEIAELDMNPLVVGREKGNLCALDVRISLRPLPATRTDPGGGI